MSARLPFRWDLFARKYRDLWLRSSGHERPKLIGEVASRLGLLGIAQSGWALDRLTHGAAEARGLAALRRSPPIFIIGHQRSGTTFMHRVLAADPSHCALTLQEMLLPASSLQAALSGLGAIDDALGGHLARRFMALQGALFGPMDDLHTVRFDQIEEDEFVLWGIFASIMVANDAPHSAGSDAMALARDFYRWSPAQQASALGYYRGCVARSVDRAMGKPPAGKTSVTKTYVGKNPAFTHKLPALEGTFPGARYILMRRDPTEAIPSRLNLIRAIWRRRFPEFTEMSRAQIDNIVADSLRTYQSAARDLPNIDASRRCVVDYQDLSADPAGAVRRVYRHLGLGAPPQPAMDLANARPDRGSSVGGRGGEAAGGVPRPRPNLEEFGLDAAEIHRRLGGIGP